jgi:riboflavin synthase
MKILRWLGLAALAVTVGGTAQAADVKIGVVLPFSGANADLGHQIDKAFDLYVKLHANDIAPHKVTIVKRDDLPDMARFELRTTRELARFIAAKGSVTLDGVSLTVNTVHDVLFSVLIIPHTLNVTTLGAWRAGSEVNLEVDLMARYAARLSEMK